MSTKESGIDKIIQDYNTVIKVVDSDARNDDSDRAYGGIVRSVKGKLQEHIAEGLINIAWSEVGGSVQRLKIDSKKHKIRIKQNYIENIEDNAIKDYILKNIDNYTYGISVDKQIYIDEKFIAGIECKAYTENAMIKRILVDFSFLKTKFKNISCYLFQLESQMGGDYSEINSKSFGSESSHTIMSYFDEINLIIVTLLKGERKVNLPIHKYFKPLQREPLLTAVSLLTKDFNKYV